jgi:putative holliday junction resolvase
LTRHWPRYAQRSTGAEFVANTDDRLPDLPGRSLQPPDPGRGRRLGIDVGSVRIGVATSDPDGILATPVETVARDRSNKHVRRIAQLVSELEAVEVVVGLPRTLADRSGPAARDAIALAGQLARRIAPTPVRLADERLTTVTAQRSLREAGVRAKGQRSMIDQAAAVGILQNWLDQRRAASRTRGANDHGAAHGEVGDG